MRMVGATNGFIRWPFVYEGFMLGLLGAVIAFFLQDVYKRQSCWPVRWACPPSWFS